MARRTGESRLSWYYHRRRYQINAFLVGLLATALIGMALSFLLSWTPYFIWLVAINTVTFIMFALDKGLSKTKMVRVPEVVLHIFTLLGGFVGQLAARLLFNHKTNFSLHPVFTIVLAPSILIHGALIIFFLSSATP